MSYVAIGYSNHDVIIVPDTRSDDQRLEDECMRILMTPLVDPPAEITPVQVNKVLERWGCEPLNTNEAHLTCGWNNDLANEPWSHYY